MVRGAMNRLGRMRSRETELEARPESESEEQSLSPSPAPRIGVNLSSMVVKPAASSGGGSDIDIRYTAGDRTSDSPPLHLLRRNSSQDPHPRISPASVRRHRLRSPDGFLRRISQPGLNRRGSPLDSHRRMSPPHVFHPRSQRFQNDSGQHFTQYNSTNSGYVQRSDSISPPRRLRADEGYFEPDFGNLRGSQFGRGLRGRRGGSRFRGASPAFGRGGGRPFTRGFNSSARVMPSFEGDFVHRNDPNLSPREGDWICRNPSCGNLNFARRTYCNNCQKCRYTDEPYGLGRSPVRKGYAGGPPQRRSFSPRSPALPPERNPRRDFEGYRSPPARGWDGADAFDAVSAVPLRRGGKFINHQARRDHRMDFREDGLRVGGRRSDWLAAADGGGRGDAFVSEGRANRRPPSPRDRWDQQGVRGRSRSPLGGGRFPRGGNSFVGPRSRDDRRRYDRPYAENGRVDGFESSDGRVYRRMVSRGRSPASIF